MKTKGQHVRTTTSASEGSPKSATPPTLLARGWLLKPVTRHVGAGGLLQATKNDRLSHGVLQDYDRLHSNVHNQPTPIPFLYRSGPAGSARLLRQADVQDAFRLDDLPVGH